MRLPDGPESRYLAETVGVPLQHALADVCVMRPRDPIEYLAQCLYRFAEGVERERQEEAAQELLRKNATDELLASQHLAIVLKNEDEIMRNEQERRKKLYLDREREVEIINSPRSSRSRKSSVSGDDLGASSNFGASVGVRHGAASNPNELTVPGPVPPVMDPPPSSSSGSGMTDDGGQVPSTPADTHIKVDTDQQAKPPQPEGDSAGAAAQSQAGGEVSQKEAADTASPQVPEEVKVETEGQSDEVKDAGSALPVTTEDGGSSALAAPGGGGQALAAGGGGEAGSQLPQDNGNDDSKVAAAPRANETPGEPEVAGDSSKPEAAGGAATAPAAEGEAGKDLYTIGEQEED